MEPWRPSLQPPRRLARLMAALTGDGWENEVAGEAIEVPVAHEARRQTAATAERQGWSEQQEGEGGTWRQRGYGQIGATATSSRSGSTRRESSDEDTPLLRCRCGCSTVVRANCSVRGSNWTVGWPAKSTAARRSTAFVWISGSLQIYGFFLHHGTPSAFKKEGMST